MGLGLRVYPQAAHACTAPLGHAAEEGDGVGPFLLLLPPRAHHCPACPRFPFNDVYVYMYICIYMYVYIYVYVYIYIYI